MIRRRCCMMTANSNVLNNLAMIKVPLMRYSVSVMTCCVLALAVITSVPIHAENWVRFRGPNGQGISAEKNLPVEWSATENVVWKSEIPGEGWSSPIVFEDQIFLTATTDEGTSCHVVCVDRTNGEIRWNRQVHRQAAGAKRLQNSYATPTPVTDGKRVYAVFSDGTIVAINFEGETVWTNSEIDFHSLHGLGASPILANGQLIMPFDGSSPDEKTLGWKTPWDKAVVLSLDTETGSVRWKGSRGQSRVGHVTPILIENGRQLVSAGGDRVQGFDVTTGEQLWSIYSQGEGVTPSPVIGDDMVITSSGFEEPTIRAIRLGGSGDVTETHIAWEQKKGVPALPSFLYVSPYVYSITRDNILHCIEASSGDVVWFKRLSGSYSASPVYADGKIYLLSEEGVTLVLRPGDSYEEIARNNLDEKCMASMAVSQGNFFIRTANHLYCIGSNGR